MKPILRILLCSGLLWAILPGSLKGQDSGTPDLDAPEGAEQKMALAHVRGGVVLGDGSYAPGDFAELTAQPYSGWTFSHWLGPVEDPDKAETRVQMNGHLTVQPVFKRVWNVILVPLPPDGGTVQGGGVIPVGELTEISAEAAEGYEFVSWEDPYVEDPGALQTKLEVNGEHTVVARFQQSDSDDQSDDSSDSSESEDNESDQSQDQSDDIQSDDSESDSESQQDEESDQEQNENPSPEEDDPTESEGEEPEQPEQEDAGQPEQQDASEQPAQPGQMSREEAEQLLNALLESEKMLPAGDPAENVSGRSIKGRDW